MDEVQVPPRRRIASRASVNVRQLARGGVFGPKDSEFGWYWAEPDQLASYVRAFWNAQLRILTLDTSGRHVGPPSSMLTIVKVVEKKCARATKLYFQMKGSNALCERLYIAGGKIGTRQEFGLKYQKRGVSQRLRPRARVAAKDEVTLLLPELKVDKAVAQPYSFKAAVAKGKSCEDANAREMARIARASTGRLTEVEEEPATARKAWPIELVSEYPQLDVLELQRSGHLHPGRRETIFVQWEAPTKRTVTGAVTIDLTAGSRPMLLVRFETALAGRTESVRMRRIKLSAPAVGAPNQWAALCPLTGRRVRYLFLRAGSWGSAHALRLIKPSQRSADFGRRRRERSVDRVNGNSETEATASC